MTNFASPHVIQRCPLLMYFVFSYAFFWLLLIVSFSIVFGLLGMEMDAVPGWIPVVIPILGSWMPSLAAAVVTGVCEGREANRRLFGKFFQFHLPLRWYLAALIPGVLTFAAAGIYRLFGGEASGEVDLSLGFWAVLFVQTFFSGATGEEPGWRGFAMPRLMQQYTPLKAGLLLGAAWGFWHLPLWFLEPFTLSALLLYILGFMVFIISLNLVMTWIFLRTSHSLVPMVVAHFGPNFMMAVVVDGLGLSPRLPVFYLTAGLTLLAAVIIAATGGLSRSPATTKQPVDKVSLQAALPGIKS